MFLIQIEWKFQNTDFYPGTSFLIFPPSQYWVKDKLNIPWYMSGINRLNLYLLSEKGNLRFILGIFGQENDPSD
jgi:hypothetical protein